MPAVWQRWFVDLFRRIGTQSTTNLDDLEASVASGSESSVPAEITDRLDSDASLAASTTQDRSGELLSILAGLDEQSAGVSTSNLSQVLERLTVVEDQLTALTVPNVADILKRIDPVWDDIQGSIALATGVSALTLEVYRDTPSLLYHFRHNQDDALTFVYQIPHGWNPTTSVKPHIHWIPCADPAAAEVVRFSGQYAWTNPSTALPANASWTTFAVSATVNPGDVFKEKITALATVAPPSGFKESAILVVYLMRPGATDAADTYTTGKGTGTAAANVALLSSDTHYQKNKTGTFAEFPT